MHTMIKSWWAHLCCLFDFPRAHTVWNSIFRCLLSLCHMKLLLVEKTYSWSSFQDKQRQYPLIKQIYIWHFFNQWCSLYIHQDLSHSQFWLEAIYLCLNWYVEGMFQMLQTNFLENTIFLRNYDSKLWQAKNLRIW